MTIEELMDLQEAGARAYVLGLKTYENPYLDPSRMPTADHHELGDWLARHDAWKFGWDIESASREGQIVTSVRELLASPRHRATNDQVSLHTA
ncbi:CrpP-related protein [Rhizobium sp. 768_B6_N1_8]|jgi:hypothetical protein|uniref:CrpP-related protein n=1 Tax=unclassified Rhizobium TaxID=2613769 RepID=UPI003F22419F